MLKIVSASFKIHIYLLACCVTLLLFNQPIRASIPSKSSWHDWIYPLGLGGSLIFGGLVLVDIIYFFQPVIKYRIHTIKVENKFNNLCKEEQKIIKKIYNSDNCVANFSNVDPDIVTLEEYGFIEKADYYPVNHWAKGIKYYSYTLTTLTFRLIHESTKD